MNRYLRWILAIAAGVAVWTALWFAGTRLSMAMFPQWLQEGQPITHAGILVFYIAYSSVLSVLAGFTTAALAGDGGLRPVYVLAVLQLAFGIAAELSYWALMPVWYHVIFLALVVPATIWGGHLNRRRAAGSTEGHTAEPQ